MVSMTEVFAAKIWEAFQGLMAHHGAKADWRYDNPAKVIHGVTGYPVFTKEIDGGFLRFHLEHLKGESYEVAVCYPGATHESVISSFGMDVNSYIEAIEFVTDAVVGAAESVKFQGNAHETHDRPAMSYGGKKVGRPKSRLARPSR